MIYYINRYTILHVFLISIFSIILIPCLSQAQENTSLRVLITSDVDGTPIPGANVALLDPESGDILSGGITDTDGFHQFSDINAIEYQLKVSFVGFRTYSQPINGEQGVNKIVRVSLSPEISSLDEVIVQAEREVTTGEAGVTKISREDISRIPSPVIGGDLSSYLQSVPGVISTGDRGGELYVRGGNPSQNQVLVDNLPVVKPFHISNLFSAFPEKSIQTVDLYAGGFGAEFTDATSAILDINLKPGNYKEASGGAAVSPYVSSIFLQGPIKEDEQSFMISGRLSTIEKFAPQLAGEEKRINFNDVLARYTFRGGNYVCNVTGLHTYDRGRVNPFRDVDIKYRNSVVGGRCLGFAESFNFPIDVTVGYSYYTNSQGPSGQNERESNYSQLFFRFDHKQYIFGHQIDYGFKLNFRNFNATLSERFTNVTTFESKEPVLNAYISTVFEPSENLTIEPSLGTLGTFKFGPTLEPRLRMAYRPGSKDNIEISLAGGRYYQSISGISDIRDAGNIFRVWRPVDRNLPTQSALHGILGYQQRFGNYLKINIEGYVKDYKNISVPEWTPVAQLETETTTANGLVYGGDIRMEYDRLGFYFLTSYGYANVEYKAATDDLGAWVLQPVFRYNPAHDQRHKLNSVLSYEYAGFTVSTRWEFGSGQPYTQVYGFDLAVDVPGQEPLNNAGTARTLFSRPFGGRLPVYHRLDFSVERSFPITEKFALDAEAGAINVYDQSNVFFFDSNTLQRVNQTSFLPYVAVRAQFN